MDEVLIERIRHAKNRAMQQFYARPYRGTTHRTPSQEAVDDHGPEVIEELLTEVVTRLTQKSPATGTTEEEPAHAVDWQEFFEPHLKIDQAAYDSTQSADAQRHAFPLLLERVLRPSVHSWTSAGWMLLGHVLRSSRWRHIGIVEAWAPHGFNEVHEHLMAAFPEPTAARHEAIETLARLIAYIICSLESSSSPEDLLPLKHILSALAAGSCPTRYDAATKTLYVSDWYAL